MFYRDVSGAKQAAPGVSHPPAVPFYMMYSVPEGCKHSLDREKTVQAAGDRINRGKVIVVQYHPLHGRQALKGEGALAQRRTL